MSLRPFPSATSAGSHLTRHKGSKAWNPPARSLCSRQREASTFTGRAVTPSPRPPVPTGHVPQDGGGLPLGVLVSALARGTQLWSGSWLSSEYCKGGGDGDGDAVKQGLYDSQT